MGDRFFAAEDDLLRVLREFARGFSADVDPLTQEGCAYWFGEARHGRRASPTVVSVVPEVLYVAVVSVVYRQSKWRRA